MAAGMSDFMTKPVRPEVLDQILLTWSSPELVASVQAPQEQSSFDDEVDIAMLEMLVENLGKATASKIVAKASENARDSIAQLGESKLSGKTDLQRRAAHSLAGLFMQVGYAQLGARMEEVERDDTLVQTLDMEELLTVFEWATNSVMRALVEQTNPKRDARAQNS